MAILPFDKHKEAREAQMNTFTINGRTHSFDGDPEMPLLWYLLDVAGMTGTKFGCGQALCGACTVHVDGTAARAARPEWAISTAGPSPPSKACRRTACMRFRW